MSINILRTPEQFQPVLSDGLFFTVSADTTDKYKFRYVYDLYVNDEFVFEGKSTPNPYGLGVFDLQQILETYCLNIPISDWNGTPIYTHQTFPFSAPYENETISYKLAIGYEYSDTANGSVTGFTGIGDTAGFPAYFTQDYKTFRSTMGVNGRATQENFDIGPFVLSGTPGTYNPTTSGLFLTNSPRVRDIQPSEYYTLAFTNYFMGGSVLSEPYYVKYTFYDSEGIEITGTTYDNITTNGGGPRWDCNQVYQSIYLIVPPENTDYNTLYVGAGPQNIPNFPPNCKTYTVQLWGLFEGSTSPIQPTPTPTPTPTLTTTPGITTPTPTPTATTPCECLEYEVINSNEGTVTVFFTDCVSGSGDSFIAFPDVVYNICSCSEPFSESLISVTEVGSCYVPVTPTPTPTLTLTPSSEGYDYYSVVNCDNPFDTLTVAYNGFLAIGKVVRLQTIDGCYEITSGGSAPYDDLVSFVYNSCETCPR
jgi:hypothetical protein